MNKIIVLLLLSFSSWALTEKQTIKYLKSEDSLDKESAYEAINQLNDKEWQKTKKALEKNQLNDEAKHFTQVRKLTKKTLPEEISLTIRNRYYRYDFHESSRRFHTKIKVLSHLQLDLSYLSKHGDLLGEKISIESIICDGKTFTAEQIPFQGTEEKYKGQTQTSVVWNVLASEKSLFPTKAGSYILTIVFRVGNELWSQTLPLVVEELGDDEEAYTAFIKAGIFQFLNHKLKLASISADDWASALKFCKTYGKSRFAAMINEVVENKLREYIEESKNVAYLKALASLSNATGKTTVIRNLLKTPFSLGYELTHNGLKVREASPAFISRHKEVLSLLEAPIRTSSEVMILEMPKEIRPFEENQISMRVNSTHSFANTFILHKVLINGFEQELEQNARKAWFRRGNTYKTPWYFDLKASVLPSKLGDYSVELQVIINDELYKFTPQKVSVVRPNSLDVFKEFTQLNSFPLFEQFYKGKIDYSILEEQDFGALKKFMKRNQDFYLKSQIHAFVESIIMSDLRNKVDLSEVQKKNLVELASVDNCLKVQVEIDRILKNRSHWFVEKIKLEFDDLIQRSLLDSTKKARYWKRNLKVHYLDISEDTQLIPNSQNWLPYEPVRLTFRFDLKKQNQLFKRRQSLKFERFFVNGEEVRNFKSHCKFRAGKAAPDGKIREHHEVIDLLPTREGEFNVQAILSDGEKLYKVGSFFTTIKLSDEDKIALEDLPVKEFKEILPGAIAHSRRVDYSVFLEFMNKYPQSEFTKLMAKKLSSFPILDAYGSRDNLSERDRTTLTKILNVYGAEQAVARLDFGKSRSIPQQYEFWKRSLKLKGIPRDSNGVELNFPKVIRPFKNFKISANFPNSKINSYTDELGMFGIKVNGSMICFIDDTNPNTFRWTNSRGFPVEAGHYGVELLIQDRLGLTRTEWKEFEIKVPPKWKEAYAFLCELGLAQKLVDTQAYAEANQLLQHNYPDKIKQYVKKYPKSPYAKVLRDRVIIFLISNPLVLEKDKTLKTFISLFDAIIGRKNLLPYMKHYEKFANPGQRRTYDRIRKLMK